MQFKQYIDLVNCKYITDNKSDSFNNSKNVNPIPCS